MKQVVQNFRTGELFLEEVPAPTPRPHGLLVRTLASAVSAGTERSKVDLARKNIVAKALARPDQVRKVLDTLQREGVKNTYNKVVNKLDALSPLGYSAAGKVVAVGEDCAGFAVGDRVACAGAGYANHAEVIWVPKNLCTQVPPSVDIVDAAFTTIGAIALQGIRQAEVQYGENVAVIGLGLIGQLTVQLLRAAGCHVIGIDIAPWSVELAKKNGANVALQRDDDVAAQVLAATNGLGADAIIITAGATTNDPFVLAGSIARDRAKVVLVGAVPIDIPRSPFYEKELDIRLSRSYGPGRYDVAYEEQGIEYPVGYVRWSENRNMQAFLKGLEAKQVSLESLITHRIKIDEASRAYDLISGRTSERYLGVALVYKDAPNTQASASRTHDSVIRGSTTNVGFVGAGSFAGGTLIPLLKQHRNVALAKVCTSSGLTARDVAKRHGFTDAVSDASEIIEDPRIDAVFIATRHNTHAALVIRALRRGKTVFVEKPLALARDELSEVITAASAGGRLLVGFNRRFSPHSEHVLDAFRTCAGARVISIRVNAGAIPTDSWIHDPAIGGGRLLGEGCHFIDLAQHLAGARPLRVTSAGVRMPDPGSRLQDNVNVSIEFANGSLATVTYTSKGDMAIGKERIEVFGGGISAVIDDFSETTIARRGRVTRFKTKQDKGHAQEIAAFLRMASGGPAAIDLDELHASSLATLAAAESLSIGASVEL